MRRRFVALLAFLSPLLSVGLQATWEGSAQAQALPLPAGKRRAALEPPRLSYVSPAVRTQTRRGEWLEALPEQAVEPNTRVATGKAGGAEITVGSEIHLTLEPATTIFVKKLPKGGRGAGTVELISGTLLIEVAETRGIGPITVRTADGELKLRGATARITSDGPGHTSVAVYQGIGAVRIRGTVTEVAAGHGALLLPPPGPRGTPLPLRDLPAAPGWPDGVQAKKGAEAEPPPPLLSPALAGLNDTPTSSELRIDFAPTPGAAGYVIELARDPRFTDRRLQSEVSAPSLKMQLPPGLHYVRATAFDSAHIMGRATATRAIYLVPLLTNATRDEDGELQSSQKGLRLVRRKGVALRAVGGGLPLRLVFGRASQDCSGECLLRLGPGEHRVMLALDEAQAAIAVSVPLPPPPPPEPPPPPPIETDVEPIDLSAPLFAHGFPLRSLDPRTRAYALAGIGSTDTARSVNVLRLDVGGEIMLIRRRLSLDLNIPLLYFLNFPAETGGERSGIALGDISIGGRFVAAEALNGALRFGPLLRLQAPTGTYERGPNPTHPVVIDPALGLSLHFGRLGLLTTQGLPVSVNVQPVQLRWAMSYLAEVRISKVGLLAGLDAAIGLYGNVPSGAALGGGLRLHLGQKETWRLLAGARGGLGSAGQSLFGVYSAAIGVEWMYH